MEVDALLLGGGIAGLWTLDHLRRQGFRVLLAENRALGTGQTISSQGIIHGGLKYSLRGMLTPSAREIREMPLVWRECLSGQREPNLSRTLIRGHSCHLWQTSTLASQAGMLGAQLNLQVKPRPLSEAQRPEILQGTPGQVFRLDEQVLSPASLLECFLERNAPWLLKIDAEQGMEWTSTSADGAEVRLRNGDSSLRLRARCVILTAGAGNALLSRQAGHEQSMQRRPLRMVLMRGPLPVFQGHCIDGAKTRLTVTSEVLSREETVWQLGGQLAEQGAGQSEQECLQRAVAEVRATLPAIDLASVRFASYEIDRAERKSGLGLRPDTPQLLREGRTVTCWPTKLAFAPRVAELLEQMLKQELGITPTDPADWVAELSGWERPPVARSPWEEVTTWYRWEKSGLVAEPPASEPLAA